MQVGPVWAVFRGRAGLLVVEPVLDRGAGVAAVAAELVVGEAAGTGCFANPGFGHGEQFGDIARKQQPLASAVGVLLGVGSRGGWRGAFLLAGAGVHGISNQKIW